MVGWNIAATQLVLRQVLYKISNPIHFASTITFTIYSLMDRDEHVDAGMNVCLIPLYDE